MSKQQADQISRRINIQKTVIESFKPQVIEYGAGQPEQLDESPGRIDTAQSMTDVQDFKLTKEEKLIMDQQYLKIKLPVENTVDEQSVSMSQQATL